MAFSQSNSRELQNRKILEELQLKKQMLLKQGVAPTLNTSLVTSTGSPSNLVNIYLYIIFVYKIESYIFLNIFIS